MAATDVAVNLRYPSAGETSASLLRLLADRKCTMVSAYRQFLEIPADAVVRIPCYGRVESLNVGVACGILLAHWRSRNQEAPCS